VVNATNKQYFNRNTGEPLARKMKADNEYHHANNNEH